MLTFLTGLDFRSKRSFISQKISNLLDENKRVYLIVPEQSSFDRDRDFLFSYGEEKSNRLTVTGFTRFARELLEENGINTKTEADDTARTVLMSLACEQVGDSLTMYARHASRPAAVKELLSSYSEIKQAGLTPDMLIATASGLNESILRTKSRELALIFSAYESLVTERFSESTDNIPKAEAFIRGYNGFSDCIFFFDDFRGYTAQQQKLISAIIAKCGQSYVSVTANSLAADSAASFSHAVKNALVVLRRAKAENIQIFEKNTDPDTAADESAFFCRSFMSEEKQIFDGETDNIKIISAPDKYSECECVAAEIQSLLENGFRCRDIGVFERGADYAPALVSALKKRGIPVLEDTRRPLAQYPLIRMLMFAVNIAANGFTTEKVLQYLKTGVTGITDDECDELENYVTLWGIEGSAWENDFNGNPGGYAVELTEELREKLRMINDIRARAVKPLLTLKSIFADRNPEKNLRAVYGFFSETNAAQNFLNYAVYLNLHGAESEALECSRVWDECMEHLDALNETLSGITVTPRRFFELLTLMFTSGSMGDIPAGTDQIIIGSAERTRFSPFTRAIFAVGVNDGVFPRSASLSGVFTPNEKRRLAKKGFTLESVPENFYAEERLIAFNAFTCFSEKLYVSFCTGSVAGEEMRASEIVESVKNIFPGCRSVRAGALPIGMRITSPASAFEEYAALPDKNSKEGVSLRAALEKIPGCGERLNALQNAIDGTPSHFRDSEISKQLFGTDMYMSPSRLEAYHKCPFGYFCRYGVMAKKTQAADFDARVNGLLLHRVFEVLLSRYTNDELIALDDETRFGEICKITDEYVETEMGGKNNLPARFIRQIEKQKLAVAQILDRMVREFGTCSFKTVSVELPIEYNSAVKPYRINLENGGSVTIHGTVDRVDVMQVGDDKYLRIIDYKTGGKDFNLADCISGLNMQMLIYLMCIWDNGGEMFGDIIPAGVLYVPAKTGGKTCDRHATPEDILRQKLENGRMNGIFLESETVIKGMEAAARGVYINASIDDKNRLKGNFLSYNQFRQLHKKLNEIIAETAKKMQDGEIPVLPLLDGNYKKTCEYCDYSDVCLREEDGEKRTLPNLKHDDVRKMLDDEAKGE